MNDVRGKYVAPSVNETAFSCPHCGTLTTQTWYSVHARHVDGTPLVVDAEWIAKQERKTREKIPQVILELSNGRPRLDENRAGNSVQFVGNLFVSHCFECKQVAIWIYNKLIWPIQTTVPKPNPDMPADVRMDYEEASEILDLSPRGAAALVRLCLQKLFKSLGEKGENLNDDIASLVRKGLDPHIQQALDILRVTGNNAVHPGQMDIKDDRGIASKLFVLLNLIVDELISKPARIRSMYDGLPEKDRAAIEQRNAKVVKSGNASTPEDRR
jgi:hypothetical protein